MIKFHKNPSKYIGCRGVLTTGFWLADCGDGYWNVSAFN